MTPDALWKIHRELDEIESEKEIANANERIMRLMNEPIMSREEVEERLKILKEIKGINQWW